MLAASTRPTDRVETGPPHPVDGRPPLEHGDRGRPADPGDAIGEFSGRMPLPFS
jgi:hypothetical protein